MLIKLINWPCFLVAIICLSYISPSDVSYDSNCLSELNPNENVVIEYLSQIVENGN